MSAWSWLVDAVSGAPSYTGRAARQGNSVSLAGATPTRPFGGINGVRPMSAQPVAVAGLVVTIGVHAGVLDLETSNLAGPTPYSFDTSQTVTINAAPSAPNSRIDLISVRQDDHTEDGATTSQPVIVYTAGTAANPGTQPATPARCMLLAVVNVPNTGSATVSWVAPNTVAAGGIVPTTGSSQYPGTPYEGQYVDDSALNMLMRWTGSTWAPVAVNAAERLQLVKATFASTSNTPGSGTSLWATIGSPVVPVWATQATIKLDILSLQTPSTALNCTMQLKLGTVNAASSYRIPGSATNTPWQCFGYTDLVTGIGALTGAQSLTLNATFSAGTGVFSFVSGSTLTALVEFLP